MLHFHATKKLLDVSRVDSVLYVSEPDAGQQLHNWYVVLCGSGFVGEMLLLYVHEPSLLTVVVAGKTIASTINTFRQQLKQLLIRHKFPLTFIEKEMLWADKYVIGKTNSRSMLSLTNEMVAQVKAYHIVNLAGYNEFDPVIHEDIFMGWLYKTKAQKGYQTAKGFWAKYFAE